LRTALPLRGSTSPQRWIQNISRSILILAFGTALFAGVVAPAGYDEQFRDHPNAPPSQQFPLGTDELGRDRLSRLLYGCRVSLLLAPAAAALATGIGLLMGAAAGYGGGWAGRAALELTDLVASVPSLLLLLFARAMLPLNVPAEVSVSITFFLLGTVGWTSGVRLFAAAIARVRDSEYVRQAIASGSRPYRVLFLHLTGAMLPVITAQFWVLVPLFLLAEANLGILGLGVSEPLPSLGNLLAEIQITPALREQPVLVAPAVVLLMVLLSAQQTISTEESIQ
jgi:ABC-type dipeptide/oligopeptide/nickel transport system permease subunit